MIVTILSSLLSTKKYVAPINAIKNIRPKTREIAVAHIKFNLDELGSITNSFIKTSFSPKYCQDLRTNARVRAKVRMPNASTPRYLATHISTATLNKEISTLS